MRAIWILARKDLRLLLRDPKAAVILLVMPLIFIMVLGLSLGEGFGQKPDDRLRVSIVDLDQGTPTIGYPGKPWSHVVMEDLKRTAGIRLEVLASREEAEQLVRNGQRAAVIVFGANFSKRVQKCSFLAEGINPFYRDGVDTGQLDVDILEDKTQLTAASIIKQVAQGTLLRVVLPWMIGQAFGKIGDPDFVDRLAHDEKFHLDISFEKVIDKFAASPALNQLDLPFDVLIDKLGMDKNLKIQVKVFGFNVDLQSIFANLTPPQKKDLAAGLQKALNFKSLWGMLNEQQKHKVAVSLQQSFDVRAVLDALDADQKKSLAEGLQSALQGIFPNYDLTAKDWSKLTKSTPHGGDQSLPTVGLFNQGDVRYQLLVPSYTVMFAFFLVLTVGWLFVAERRQGTLKRLSVAPLTRGQIVLGKLLPCLLLSLFQGFFLLGAGRLLFGLNWGPEPLWLVPVVVSTSLAAMGLALLVAALARTETQVAIYGTLLVLVLAGVSGSLMGDRSLMPPQMQQVSKITPHAWALDAYRQLLANPGEPNYAIVAWACIVLVGFGLGFLALAWWALRLE